jgi:ADP-ribose pyrophosphatase YjhB (NUDIX family)
VIERIHLAALHLYQRLPLLPRRWIVRTMAPSYTVGAMCFIERRGGDVLLVRQSYRRNWGVPGGLLRRGEDPGDGARREVLEEVGLVIDLVGEPAVVVEADPQRVDLVYRAVLVDETSADRARPLSPEVVEARWFPRHALPELQHETAAALVHLARVSRGAAAPPLPI